jgi:hypothetical protein
MTTKKPHVKSMGLASTRNPKQTKEAGACRCTYIHRPSHIPPPLMHTVPHFASLLYSTLLSPSSSPALCNSAHGRSSRAYAISAHAAASPRPHHPLGPGPPPPWGAQEQLPPRVPRHSPHHRRPPQRGRPAAGAQSIVRAWICVCMCVCMCVCCGDRRERRVVSERRSNTLPPLLSSSLPFFLA